MSMLTKIARKSIVAVVKPFPPLRRLARDTINSRRSRIYRQIRRSVNVEPKTIIFESFMGRSYSDNPRAIYEAMLKDKRLSDYRFIWAFKSDKLAELNDLLPDKQRTSVVPCGTADYYRAYAQAGIWVSNSRLPEYLQPTKAQRYIQTWHGTPLKRLGYDIEVEGENAMNTKRDICQKYDNDSKRYTAMISPSPFVTDCYKSAFDLDKNNPKCQIWQVGYPRNDSL